MLCLISNQLPLKMYAIKENKWEGIKRLGDIGSYSWGALSKARSRILYLLRSSGSEIHWHVEHKSLVFKARCSWGLLSWCRTPCSAPCRLGPFGSWGGPLWLWHSFHSWLTSPGGCALTTLCVCSSCSYCWFLLCVFSCGNLFCTSSGCSHG